VLLVSLGMETCYSAGRSQIASDHHRHHYQL